MGMSLETRLGTVRVYEFRRPARAGTQAVSYRARLWFHGEYRDGKPCRTQRLAVESLLKKLQVGDGRQQSILDRLEFPVAMIQPSAMSQPSAEKKKKLFGRKKRHPRVHVFRKDNSQKAAIRYFARPTDQQKSNAAVAPRSLASLFQLACDGTRGVCISC